MRNFLVLGRYRSQLPITPNLVQEKLYLYNLQVLEVSARELIVGNDLNLALAGLLDDDGVAEVTNTALNLDLVLEELLEGGSVEDLIARGLLGVDDELEDGMSTCYHARIRIG